jgi:hypothetical protein
MSDTLTSLFRSPPARFRGAPFWAWNDKLDVDQLLRQIDVFRRMGFGGFNMHPRTGLATECLGDDYFRAVRACVDEAAKLGMTAWLYDEDRWPSGYAGGRVTRDRPELRTRHLLWTKTPYGQGAPRKKSDYTTAVRTENGSLLARFAIDLVDGRLASYRRLENGEPDSSSTWYAYLETMEPNAWFNGATYINTLRREPVEAFLRETHDRYAQHVGEQFGKVVPAIFTDEPQHVKKSTFGKATDTHDLFMPWSDDFDSSFVDTLPELFWNLPGDAPSAARWRYHNEVAERFATCFSGTISQWCESHNIKLTGHALGEATLHGQTRGGGEAMRTLAPFHIPGIDILCDKTEYATVLQARSVARQFAREGVLSELYGVTDWDLDFASHKAQGDWQAVLGVTVRVPHLAWMSMRGEAKRDYPASIFSQSPWWERYGVVEDHFARVNVLMTRGTPRPRVAVIHPIESGWLTWGPAEQNRDATARLEAAFENVTKWLLHGLMDFDYASEALLASLPASVENRQLVVGAMRYDAVVVPACITLRSSTLKLLEAMQRDGATVIFAGDVPTCVDAAASDAAARLAARSARVALTRDELLRAVDRFADVVALRPDGTREDALLVSLRDDDGTANLFAVNTDRAKPRSGQLRVRGAWDVTRFDTLTGYESPLASTVIDGWTQFAFDLPAHGHLLARLTPAMNRIATITAPAKWVERTRLADPVPVTLSEPNVLLLDLAEWRWNDEAWQPRTEVLRIDNAVRSQLGLPMRTGRSVQPWADREPAPVLGTLQLRFTVRCDHAVARPSFAFERVEGIVLAIDGTPVELVDAGHFVDECIRVHPLPPLGVGEHSLVVSIDFTRKSEPEACMLLGDFGVRLAGSHAAITSPVRTLAWGDWTRQGLPFYTGNVTYHATLPPIATRSRLHVPKFACPLVDVVLDGKTKPIAFAPFIAELPPGETSRQIDLVAYGNRFNLFGCVHHADENLSWVGPAAWRSTGTAWQDEYALKRMGILSAPIIESAG